MKAAKRASKIGRKKGSRNKGFFYRAGRGWYVSDGTTKLALRDDRGVPIKEKADAQLAKLAYKRWDDARSQREADKLNGSETTIKKICADFLVRVERDCRPRTYAKWAEILFSFCTGLRGRYRERFEAGEMTPQELAAARKEARRICEEGGGEYVAGVGEMAIGKLKKHHVTAFEKSNPGWKSQGTRRTARTAIKQACTYAVAEGVIAENPLAKMPIGGSPARKTFLTPEQEQAVYQYSTPAYGQLFKFCLRTGCRVGEYAKLEGRHVAFKPTSKGEMLVCTLAAHEHKSGSKTGKARFIRSIDPEIITMVKEAMAEHPTGKLFRTSRRKPWTPGSTCSALLGARKRITAAGIDFTYNGKSISTHSTRHTFVKNELMAGRPPAIVAILVGDTIQMILTVYAKEIEEAGGMEEKLVAHL